MFAENVKRLAGSAFAAVLLINVGLVGGCGRGDLATEAGVVAELAKPRTATEDAAMIEAGGRLFLAQSCSNCHVLAGETRGAPRLTQLYTNPAVLTDGSRVPRDRAYLARSILKSSEQVVAGYAQPMANYRAVLSETQVAALILYLEQFSPPADPPADSAPSEAD